MEPVQNENADIVLSCRDVSAAVDHYTNQLGFRLDSIFPADSPRVATMSGFGIRVRVESNEENAANATGTIHPQPSLLVTHYDGAGFAAGRAGMQYRDLIPGRYGGRFIASHIRIATGGAVPDYVHFHDIRFQLIYCVAGWVRVVYEDQGPPMLLTPGDCFLQPPLIRHRVLECSDGLEVVEMTCPAEHETRVDHDMSLPARTKRPGRDFGGQRFLYHRAADARWSPGPVPGTEYRDIGIAAATGGIASAAAVRRRGAADDVPLGHDAEIRFLFVVAGHADLVCDDGRRYTLAAGSAAAVPPGLPCSLEQLSSDVEMLEVRAPG